MIDYLRMMIDAQKAKMDERGASAVEYGLLIGLIAVAIIAVLILLGPKLAGLFTEVDNNLPTPAP